MKLWKSLRVRESHLARERKSSKEKVKQQHRAGERESLCVFACTITPFKLYSLEAEGKTNRWDSHQILLRWTDAEMITLTRLMVREREDDTNTTFNVSHTRHCWTCNVHRKWAWEEITNTHRKSMIIRIKSIETISSLFILLIFNSNNFWLSLIFEMKRWFLEIYIWVKNYDGDIKLDQARHLVSRAASCGSVVKRVRESSSSLFPSLHIAHPSLHQHCTGEVAFIAQLVVAAHHTNDMIILLFCCLSISFPVRLFLACAPNDYMSVLILNLIEIRVARFC